MQELPGSYPEQLNSHRLASSLYIAELALLHIYSLYEITACVTVLFGFSSVPKILFPGGSVVS